MKSIRHSLIVYFLLLVTAALGAVSWFSYTMSERSLRERQRETQKMIHSQFEAREKAELLEIDRRIVRQARSMAGLPVVTINYEAAFTAAMVGEQAVPQNLMTSFSHMLWLTPAPVVIKNVVLPVQPGVPTWLAQGARFDPVNDAVRRFPDRFFPKFTHVQSSEFLIANADSDHSQEYFQTYSGTGRPQQRSESMGDAWFKLGNAPELFEELFDTVDLRPGVKVRRVTLKTPVAGFAGVVFTPPPRWPNAKGGNPKAAPKKGDAPTRTQYIQYAADLGPVEATIKQHAAKRDGDLINLEEAINSDLYQLRSRMMLIGMSALAALWLGGYLVIRLGLSPLSKMSEAVSQVSPTNFSLHLDSRKLPDELQPIAQKLSTSLGQLQKAFEREKQAAADISHELRTPLAALMTTLDVALRKARSPAEYREILEECQASGQHMYQLVERLMTLARLDAGVDQFRPRDADIGDIAVACADLIRPLARARGLDLRLHVEPVAMRTDPDKLREILTNLLHNAVEYNNPNGSIVLTIERTNGRVRFEVRDTGIGIKPSEMEHLFERFYRADPSRHADTPHAGLGLSIVKSYVELMGGTIKMDSDGVSGTAFIVELPYVAPSSTAVKPELALAQH